jgi:hypothetical protein
MESDGVFLYTVGESYPFFDPDPPNTPKIRHKEMMLSTCVKLHISLYYTSSRGLGQNS